MRRSRSGRRVLTAALVVAVALGGPVWTAPAGAEPDQRQGKRQPPPDDAHAVPYVVTLDDAPAATYRGGRPGLPAARPERGRFDPDSPAAKAYARHLERQRQRVLDRAERELGRELPVEHVYELATNGVTLALTAAEAATVEAVPGVASVKVSALLELQTDAGPALIGAEQVWQADDPALATRGAGTVVGVIDTGINPSNPSFAGTGPVDGKVHVNPRGDGNYVGVCDTDQPAYDPQFPCNGKLIGAWDFVNAQDAVANDARDSGGHGSHVAGTAAGNVVDAELGAGTFSLTRRISGVAPHAHLISYKVCPSSCREYAILAAVDQSLRDGVDVLNYSISGRPTSPWTDVISRAFLAAEQAGVVVVTAAGNAGPAAGTTALAKGAPWVTSVAATTHGRRLVKQVTDLTGGENPPDALTGVGISSGVGPAPVVDVLDVAPSNRLCGDEFPPGTFTGAIVVCDSGTHDFRFKAARVRDAGGVGVIVVNTTAAESLFQATTAEPLVHLLHADGVALRAWLAEGTGHTATLTATQVSTDPAAADQMAGFSSRGPVASLPLLAPHVAAPGVAILAAGGSGDPSPAKYELMGGTSMASPHVAGSAALLRALQPAWSPSQLRSALMTTATSTVTLHDGSAATVPDRGAGRVDVAGASRAGLLLDQDGYDSADPAEGGDPRTLNTPELVDRTCMVECSWTRTLTATADGTWTIDTSGLPLQVEPAGPLALRAGDSVEITVTAQVPAAASGWTYGAVTLRAQDLPPTQLVVAVLPIGYSGPADVDTATRRDAGSHVLPAVRLAPAAPVARLALAPRRQSQHSLRQDPTLPSPYDDLTQVFWTTVEVGPGDQELLVQLFGLRSDLDLYVGRGDAPSASSEECANIAFASLPETCRLSRPEPGTWWVLVQSYEASAAGATDPFTLGTTVVGPGTADAVDLPAAPAGAPRDVRFGYDASVPMGHVLYGLLTFGSSDQAPSDLATLRVTVRRDEDDVVAVSDRAEALPGEEVEHTITVRPNVRPDALTYTLTETLAPGTSYVPGSATGGATVDDGVWRWTGMLPPAAADAQPVVLTYRTRVDVPHVRGTATSALTSEVDDPAGAPVTVPRSLEIVGCYGVGGIELDAERVAGPDAVAPGQAAEWSVLLRATACDSLRGASAQGGTVPAWSTSASTDDGSIGARRSNQRNEVLLWQIGNLDRDSTARAHLQVSGMVPADARCDGVVELTGDWTATARGTADALAPPVTVPVRC